MQLFRLLLITFVLYYKYTYNKDRNKVNINLFVLTPESKRFLSVQECALQKTDLKIK